MRALLQIATGDDHRDGCMQDVHWPSGAFGYFPTYTLGAMTAAQLFAAAQRAHPQLLADIEPGQFARLNDFLRERVDEREPHRQRPPVLVQLQPQAPEGALGSHRRPAIAERRPERRPARLRQVGLREHPDPREQLERVGVAALVPHHRHPIGRKQPRPLGPPREEQQRIAWLRLRLEHGLHRLVVVEIRAHA